MTKKVTKKLSGYNIYIVKEELAALVFALMFVLVLIYWGFGLAYDSGVIAGYQEAYCDASCLKQFPDTKCDCSDQEK